MPTILFLDLPPNGYVKSTSGIVYELALQGEKQVIFLLKNSFFIQILQSSVLLKNGILIMKTIY